MTKKEIYFGKMVHTFFVLTKDALRVYGDLGRDRLVLLYNGIDPEDCKMSQAVKERRLEFNIPEQDFIFGVVGRITKGKGHVEFIRAAYQLVKTRKNVSFVIVGGIVVVDKDYETLLHKMVEKLDLRNRVIFTGWRDDVKEVMSIFDVLVFPTTTFPEGFGLVCVEAMSLGKPVIASFIPGPSEIVMDGYTGFLIQPGDVDALVEKMEFLLDSKNTCNEMGIAGRQRVKELFDIRLATRKLEAVYEFIMKKGELYASGS